MDLNEIILDINWYMNAEQINELTQNTIERCRNICDEIAKIENPNHENVLLALNEIDIEFDNTFNLIRFIHTILGSKDRIDALEKALNMLNKFSIEMKTRKDLFDILVACSEINGEIMNEEAKRFIKHSLTERKRYGVHLEEATKNKVKAVILKIKDLEVKFLKNLNSYTPKFPFKLSELDGVHRCIIDQLGKNDNDEILVPLEYPVFYPIMKECRNPETRRKLFVEFESRCIIENTPILEQLIELRAELASMLGYKTYSHYTLESCIAKNPENVETFLNFFVEKFKRLKEQEKNIFLALKKAECESLNIKFDGKINLYDIDYYCDLRVKTEFQIDHHSLCKYFPIDAITNTVCKVYEKLLSLKIKKVTNNKTYHHDVETYVIHDLETDELLGCVYTDLYPRPGKFSHMENFPIRRSCLKEDGKRQIPVCVIGCNFTRPTSKRPALLQHSEVETFFHEFGHAIHHVCSRANFIMFSGTHVEVDFVEAPSQMLENWVWEKDVLKLISEHYQDHLKLSDELLDRLIQSRKCCNGYNYLYDIMKIKIDQYFHQHRKVDTKAIYAKYVKEMLDIDVKEMGFDKIDASPSFGHLAGGYDSKYYSYLWSEVYSYDMFYSRFKNEGILNENTGKDYRYCILEPGGRMDAHDMLESFIKREPDTEAFLIGKGIKL